MVDDTPPAAVSRPSILWRDWLLILAAGSSFAVGLPFWLGFLVSDPIGPLAVPLIGIVAALPMLIIAYAALGVDPLALRLLIAAGLALIWYGLNRAVLQLIEGGVEPTYREILRELSFLLVCFWFAWLPLAALRLLLGWRVELGGRDGPERQRVALLDVFVLMTAVACSLGALVWAKEQLGGLWRWDQLLIAGLAAVVFALLTLPLALLIVLRPAEAKWRRIRCVAYTLLLAGLGGDFILLTSGFEEADVSILVVVVMVSFSATLLGALYLIRWREYRLHWRTSTRA